MDLPNFCSLSSTAAPAAQSPARRPSHGRIIEGRTIDSQVRKIRRKLAAISPDEEIVQPAYGAGFELVFKPAT